MNTIFNQRKMNFLRRNWVFWPCLAVGAGGGIIWDRYNNTDIQSLMAKHDTDEYRVLQQEIARGYPYVNRSIPIAREAARSGHFDTVKQTKLSGLEMMDCAQYARLGGQLEILKYLEKNSDYDTESEKYLRDNMRSAVFIGHHNIVKYYESKIIAGKYFLEWDNYIFSTISHNNPNMLSYLEKRCREENHDIEWNVWIEKAAFFGNIKMMQFIEPRCKEIDWNACVNSAIRGSSFNAIIYAKEKGNIQ